MSLILKNWPTLKKKISYLITRLDIEIIHVRTSNEERSLHRRKSIELNPYADINNLEE